MNNATAKTTRQSGFGQTLHNTLVYVRQHWQLYVFFMLPAFALTIIFRYIPMGGIAVAFTEYNPIRGIFASEWVGFEHFQRFLSSPDFMKYL
ncbi:MAG: sugar ABC transporter permease, partial [Lachnospiraceae bacterium]|nr:sugar ABC transporter permease [Lachnospiraceae bacterium]